MRKLAALAFLAVASLFGCAGGTGDDGGDGGGDALTLLGEVETWGYQIQGLEEDGAVDALANSDYDLLVVEPTRSEQGSENFDTAGMVSRLKATEGASGNRKLVIAYVDVGQAEDWRTYWLDSWEAPTEGQTGTPDFLLALDPDGWAGDYQVAYWDARWRQIMLGEGGLIDQVLDDGLDGVYMDWVAAYEDEMVIAAAADAGLDPREAMIDYLSDIRTYARGRDSDFLLIQQNAADLGVSHPEALSVVDAIGHEGVWFSGEADVDWGDPASGDQCIPVTGEGHSTAFYIGELMTYQNAGKVVFTIDYAQEPTNVRNCYEASRALGFIPFVSLTPLDRLP